MEKVKISDSADSVQLNNECGYSEQQSGKSQYSINPKSRSFIESNILLNSENTLEGMDIVMVGPVGIKLAADLVKNNEAQLRTRFTSNFVDECKELEKLVDIKQLTTELVKVNPDFLYAVSETGVFSALWEIGYYCNKGMTIDIPQIPVKQEIIEVCEEFGADPYTGDGRGAVLCVCNNASNMVEYCTSRGYMAAIIGSINNTKDKIAIYGDEERYLEPNRIR